MHILKFDAPSNNLIDTLPSAQRKRFLAGISRVELDAGEVLYEADSVIRYVYFPVDCSISLLATVDTESWLEVGMVGNEGMCGYSALFGDGLPSLLTVTQCSGAALRIETGAFRAHMKNLPALAKIIRVYLAVVIHQLSRTAACTRFHVVECRLARWLSMARDRAGSDSFEVTQQFIARMLGVRRVGITEAAGFLQDAQLISYTRGQITILSRQGLARASCSCYAADLRVYSSALAGMKGDASFFGAPRAGR